MKKLLIMLVALCYTVSVWAAGTYKADARTKRVAAGTVFGLPLSCRTVPC